MSAGRLRALIVLGALAACDTTAGTQTTTSGTQTTTSGTQTTMSGTQTTMVTTFATTSTEVRPTGPGSTEPASMPPGTTPTTVASPDPLLDCVTSWPLQERIALMVWPAVYSNAWPDAVSAVGDLGLGGVILMKPSRSFADRLAGELARLDSVTRHGVLVATDEEGGVVQRLARLGPLPSQQDMSSRPDDDVSRILGEHAAVVAEAGIDVVLAPVVDVRPEIGDDPLGSGRLFIGDPDDVARLGMLYVRAWESVGILPVLKHFPGHGSASADSHDELPATPPIAQLMERDLAPYAALSTAGAGVMVGHLSVPGLTDGRPASLDPAAVRLLRDDLGFGDTLVITDALDMGAIGTDVPSAAVLAVRAGADVVIFTRTSEAGAVIDALLDAVASGTLTEREIDDSAVRVASELVQRGRPCVPATNQG